MKQEISLLEIHFFLDGVKLAFYRFFNVFDVDRVTPHLELLRRGSGFRKNNPEDEVNQDPETAGQYQDCKNNPDNECIHVQVFRQPGTDTPEDAAVRVTVNTA